MLGIVVRSTTTAVLDLYCTTNNYLAFRLDTSSSASCIKRSSPSGLDILVSYSLNAISIANSRVFRSYLLNIKLNAPEDPLAYFCVYGIFDALQNQAIRFSKVNEVFLILLVFLNLLLVFHYHPHFVAL